MSKIFHEFVITKGIDKHAAYLLSHTAKPAADTAMTYGEGTGEMSAWTTLRAAKAYACASVDRVRLPWDEIPDVDRTTWSAEFVEVVRS